MLSEPTDADRKKALALKKQQCCGCWFAEPDDIAALLAAERARAGAEAFEEAAKVAEGFFGIDGHMVADAIRKLVSR